MLKERLLVVTVSILAIASFVFAVPGTRTVSEAGSARRDISYYVPKSDELKNWRAIGFPQVFEGNELYELIDGGASIYLEYGFRRAATQEYVSHEKRIINLAIFEMLDPASAYGMYTFKVDEEGQEISLGTKASVREDYLDFWKDRYLVTVSGYDSDEETEQGLRAIAEAVDLKIEQEAPEPELVGLLLNDSLNASRVEYLKGNLALLNHYDFEAENIFGLKEGVIGRYADFTLLIFRYNDDRECVKWFQNGRDQLEANEKFEDFTEYGDDFRMRDLEGNIVLVRTYKNCILIFVGTDQTDPRVVLREVEKGMK